MLHDLGDFFSRLAGITLRLHRPATPLFTTSTTAAAPALAALAKMPRLAHLELCGLGLMRITSTCECRRAALCPRWWRRGHLKRHAWHAQPGVHNTAAAAAVPHEL